MKRWICCLALLCPAFAQAAGVLTFADAVELATRASSEQARNANLVEQSRLERDALETKDDPRVTASAMLSAKDSPWEDPPPARESGANAELTTGVQVNATLHDFGRTEAERRKADLAIAVQEHQSAETVDSLRWKVARAWVKVLATEAAVALAEEQLASATAKRQLVLENFRRGLRPEFDAARADSDLGRARLSHRRAVDERLLARTQLALLLAVPEIDIRIQGQLRKDEAAWGRILSSWEALRESAAQRTRAVARQANEAELALIVAREKPTLSAGASVAISHSRPLEEGGPSSRLNLGGQLSLTWDIPWNGAGRTDEKRVALKSRAIALQDEAELRRRTEAAALARAQVRMQLERRLLTAEQIRLAERNLALVKRKYEAGKASATELSNAEDDLISLRSDLVASDGAIASGVVDLGEAVGATDPERVFQ